MNKKRIRVKLSGRHSETAYIRLPGMPDESVPGISAKTICLDDVIEGFRGPRNLDFNSDGVVIGIEILA